MSTRYASYTRDCSVAQTPVFMPLNTTASSYICRRWHFTGPVRPFLDPIREEDPAEHHRDGEHDLDGVPEDAELLTKIGDSNVA